MTGALRILALHGYHGRGEVLRAQLAPLAGALAGDAEFVCVDAPALAAGDFGWWHAMPDESDPSGQAVRYRGWSATRAWLLDLLRDAGPFDGVFGFSQGAAVAALLAALCVVERPAQAPALPLAILAGGFASRDARHAALLERPGGIVVPSLHLIGRRDGVVAPCSSHALASRFEAPVVVVHDGGHVIPSTPGVVSAARQFLAQARPRPVARPRSTPQAMPARVADGGAPLEVPLWPGRAHPAMRLHHPRAAAGALPALVVLRGGGYARCDGSGAGSAAWAAAHGMVGVEVEYTTRATGAPLPAAYRDAARAVRLLRQHAAGWGIDPHRIAVLGYSAGGHLASLLSTRPDLDSPDDDLAHRVSARPDLLALGYPLISFVDGYGPGAFAGSTENFFGRSAVPEELRHEFSSELHVAPGHPPVFVWTTADDDLVPASHSTRFAEACRRAGVPVELTVFPHGPHGLGLALGQPGELGGWTYALLAWLARSWPAPGR